MDKDKRIKQEIKKLKSIFKDLEENKQKIADSLIDNAAFMAITLYDLQEHINKKGVVEKYQNGANQHGTKKSSEVEIYNTMIKNYNAIVKQLLELLPEETRDNDELLDFLGSGRR